MGCPPVSASATAATLLRRAVRSSPAVSAIVGSPPLRRAIGAQRAARVLRPATRFLAVEARAGVVGRYAIRGTGRTVHLRHGSRDVEIFNEIFSPARMSYRPPAEVAGALQESGALRVGDLGGNIGLFGVYALERWRVRELRSYEPDPANAALLRATIDANDDGGCWTLVRAAVSNEDGAASFEAGLLSESRIAAAGHVAGDGAGVGCAGRSGAGAGAAARIEVAVVDLFAQPPVDLLKIDIEGAEWAILTDPRLASHPARAIVLEWHLRMCPAPDPRATARALLEAAGYSVVEAGPGGPTTAGDPGAVTTNGVIWGLRR